MNLMADFIKKGLHYSWRMCIDSIHWFYIYRGSMIEKVRKSGRAF